MKKIFHKPSAAEGERRNSRNKKNMTAGIVVLGFALIGAITVISLAVSFAASVFDDSDRKREFESFIAPIVMVDPVAFSDVKTADEHVLLMSSMWNLLMKVGENSGYPEDEYGMMVIPSSDLDVSAANLFGSETELSHQTFGNTSISFEYNAENSSYIVPPMGYSVQYQPRVDKIKRKGKMYTLTVSYVATKTTLNNDEETVADKVMYYVLEKTGKNKYAVRSLIDPAASESPTTSSADESDSSAIVETESEPEPVSSSSQIKE